jgi:hypothetical protein
MNSKKVFDSTNKNPQTHMCELSGLLFTIALIIFQQLNQKYHKYLRTQKKRKNYENVLIEEQKMSRILS